MSVARSTLGVSLNANGKIYAAGGGGDNGFTDIVEEYDPVADIWTTRTPLPIAMHEFAFVLSGDKVYAIGGHSINSPAVNTNWALEGTVDTTPPVLSLPNSITVNATSPSGTVVTYTATATDDDGTNPTVNCHPPSGSTFPIGTTTVTCSATDTAGNTATGSFTLIVKGADAQLSDLLTEVRGIGPGSSLADKVTAAQNDLRSGDQADACSQLAAFLHEVKAKAGKQLTTAQAQQLKADALRIQAVIGCSP